MLSLNDVSAWIEVDGKELEQYGVEEVPNQNQVTCWIATQVNKCFSVVFRDNVADRDYSLSSSLHLDGSVVAGRLLLPSTGFSNSATRVVVQYDQILSATSSCPFMFAKLEFTDEDEYLNQSSTGLGEIQIRIYRVQPLERRLCQSVDIQAHGKVHERSKKAVTHCVSYGQEMKTAARYCCSLTYLDGNTPLATFTFKYRDFNLLQANGIIPKPPPAKKKAAIFEDVLDLTIGGDAEPEPAEERMSNVTQTKTAVPKRGNSSSEGEARLVKRTKRERKFFPTGEVIDLT